MLFKEFAGVDAFPICLATKDTDEIVAHRPGDRAGLRRHQPGGHLGAALLRDRAAAARDARHPGLPRRPARHRDRRARRAPERAQVVGKRIEDLRVVIAGAAPPASRCRDPAHRAGVRDGSSAATTAARSTAAATGLNARRRPTRRLTNPENLQGTRERAARRRRRLHRRLRPGAVSAEAVRTMADRRDRLRHGEPDPGGDAGGDRGLRGRDRDRALGLPEPDQQRARLPRRLPRRPRRARLPDHGGDEGGGGPCDRCRRARRRAPRGVHRPQRLQPRRRPGRRRRRRRGRRAGRRRPPPRPAQ